MGIIDAVKDKLSNIPGYTKPLSDAAKALDGAAPTPAAASPAEAKTPQQLQYEAKEKFLNRNNPGYVPRAKGGRVKAGGHPMKNVDNSGMTKEPC
jgi:hypothetical protein